MIYDFVMAGPLPTPDDPALRQLRGEALLEYVRAVAEALREDLDRAEAASIALAEVGS